jgi:hypothetical protein
MREHFLIREISVTAVRHEQAASGSFRVSVGDVLGARTSRSEGSQGLLGRSCDVSAGMGEEQLHRWDRLSDGVLLGDEPDGVQRFDDHAGFRVVQAAKQEGKIGRIA